MYKIVLSNLVSYLGILSLLVIPITGLTLFCDYSFLENISLL